MIYSEAINRRAICASQKSVLQNNRKVKNAGTFRQGWKSWWNLWNISKFFQPWKSWKFLSILKIMQNCCKLEGTQVWTQNRIFDVYANSILRNSRDVVWHGSFLDKFWYCTSEDSSMLAVAGDQYWKSFIRKKKFLTFALAHSKDNFQTS